MIEIGCFCIFANLRSVYNKKKQLQIVTASFLWCHQESNRGHKDFQSFALPTELWHHRCFLSQKRVQSYNKYLSLPNILVKIFKIFNSLLYISLLYAEFFWEFSIYILIIGLDLYHISICIACWNELIAENYLFFLEI